MKVTISVVRETRPEPPTHLTEIGGEHVALSPGASSYLIRHSFRDNPFLFSDPYPFEKENLWGPLEEVISLGMTAKWFEFATPLETITKRMKVPELRAQLVQHGRRKDGKKVDLIARLILSATQWVEQYCKDNPAYIVTDKGRIELQAMRPHREEMNKEKFKEMQLGFLARDIEDAQKYRVVLGYKVSARKDVHCQRKDQFCGLYLADELPNLYPVNCPAEYACCCISRDQILSQDNTPEAQDLRERLRSRADPLQAVAEVPALPVEKKSRE